MSKLTQENIWWPDCTYSHTEVVEGTNQHLSTPAFLGSWTSADHYYALHQTKEKILWVCVCGRTLSRIKYPRERF